MNYSFIDKYQVKDFIAPNPNNLYNNCDSDKKFDFNNYYFPSYEQNANNWSTEDSIQKSLLKGILTPTPLGELFFSQENINRIQQKIKLEVFQRTNGKYKIEVDQNESDLLIVMRDVYITDSANNPYKLVHQVKVLNHRTIEKIVPDMISLIKQDEEYINQLDKPINPIPLPVNVSNAGRLSLPSITTLFVPRN